MEARLAASAGRFSRAEYPVMGSWVYAKTDLDAVEDREICNPAGNGSQILGSPISHSVVSKLTV
jgi:hypothetical protein